MDDVYPSGRVVEQRLRNRAIESLELLASGADGVRTAGAAEYFDWFFDVIDADPLSRWRSWSCLTAGEVTEIDAVLEEVTAACADTAVGISDDDLIASGWPSRIARPASTALTSMRARGRFREDVEEEQPTVPG